MLPPSSGRAEHARRSRPSRKAVKLPYSEQALAQLQQLDPPGRRSPPCPKRALRRPTTRRPAERTPAAPAARRRDASRKSTTTSLGWIWPASGKIVAGFSESANLKGIDIAGKPGQPVVASAAGKVVYAGTGLRGYGKLVIVKHNNTFLSAYAHNREILVKEGQQVAKGQKIAEMGDTDADQVKLHFEIRRLGKPVDPAKFLPPA